MKQTALPFESAPSYLDADFVTTDYNQEAKSFIDVWPNWPSYGAILVGPASSGKTHLAHIWAQKAKANFIAPPFTDGLPMRAICIEAVDNLVGDHAHETQLFHMLNHAKGSKLSILCTAAKPPAEWSFALPDLASRMRALPIIHMHPPDEALLAALLAKQFYDRQIQVDAAVIQYIVSRQERSFAETLRIVNALDEAALEKKRAITVALVRDVLHW